MKNTIIPIKGGVWQRILIKGDHVHTTTSKVKTLENFDKELAKTGLMATTKTIPFSNISEIKFDKNNAETTLFFTNAKNKKKKHTFSFSSKEASSDFGEFLIQELGLVPIETPVRKIAPLLTELFLVLLLIAAIIYFFPVENFDAFIDSDFGESTSTRSGRKGSIVKLIFGFIGHKISLVLCVLAAVVTANDAFKRYQNPGINVVYRKSE